MSEPAPLNFNVFETAEALSRAAAQEIIDVVQRKPEALLCLATGNTPTRSYELLAQAAALAPDLFQRVRILKLDEWGGLDMNDPGASETYLRQHVLGPWRIDDARYFGFQSDPADQKAECVRYREGLARNGPVDLAVLGLGINGHVALNEPAEALKPFAHVAQLAPTSLHHSMLVGKQPTFGLTPGMADILSARRILFLVSGLTKREPLRRLLEPLMAPQFPASFLWLHGNAVVMCDQAAMGSLPG